MDRLSKLRDLVDRAHAELSHPAVLTRRQHLLAAMLHDISLEIARLRTERLRRAVSAQDEAR